MRHKFGEAQLALMCGSLGIRSKIRHAFHLGIRVWVTKIGQIFGYAIRRRSCMKTFSPCSYTLYLKLIIIVYRERYVNSGFANKSKSPSISELNSFKY